MNMFQKPLAFLLLLSHINFFMFIAQVDEVDCYNADGTRINDINSLTEYINDVILHRQSKSREDEDDDNARYFHIVRLPGVCLPQQAAISVAKPSNNRDLNYSFYTNDKKPLNIFFDVVTPPPRLFA
jgi:hypothetical protein